MFQQIKNKKTILFYKSTIVKYIPYCVFSTLCFTLSILIFSSIICRVLLLLCINLGIAMERWQPVLIYNSAHLNLKNQFLTIVENQFATSVRMRLIPRTLIINFILFLKFFTPIINYVLERWKTYYMNVNWVASIHLMTRSD